MSKSNNAWIARLALASAIVYTTFALPSAAAAEGSAPVKLICTAAATIPAHLLVYYATRNTPKENHLAEALYCLIYGIAFEKVMKNVFLVQGRALRLAVGSLFIATLYAVLRFGPRLIRHYKRAR